MTLLMGILLGAAFVCTLIYLIFTAIIGMLPINAGRKILQKSPQKKFGTFLKCLGIALVIVLMIFPVVLTNLV